jgi:hypothetical protein
VLLAEAGPRNRAERRHPELRELLDYPGAAQFLGCTPRLVRKLVETRQLDSVVVGSRLVRIEPAAILRFIERHRREAVGV